MIDLVFLLFHHCIKNIGLTRPSFSLSFQYGQQTFDLAGMPFVSQATREPSRGSSPEWLHMQVGGGFERTT